MSKPQRLAMYNQGMTDQQIAEIEGVTVHRITGWRNARRLPNNKPMKTKQPRKPIIHIVPMESVLKPNECKFMRHFFKDLDRCSSATNVSEFLKTWRQTKGERLCREIS